MSRDPLSDVLRAVRLRGAVFFYVDGEAPWVVETPESAKLIPAILPDVEHLVPFHGVARGSCWTYLPDGEPMRLNEGDLVLYPQGAHHVMSSAPGLRAEAVDMGLYFAPRPSRLPTALSLTPQGLSTVRLHGGGKSETTVCCGFLGCDARPFNPLLAAMPDVLRLPGVAANGNSWIADFLHVVVEECNRRRPGGAAVIERMSEMLCLEVLRRYAESLPPGQTGWFAGLRDPAVGRALSLMHERPADAWTIERLAEAAALSRTVLHERFVHFIGQPPMQYLARWRMQLAAGWLRDTDGKVADIAREVGYESEASFARAFRRMTGESPGAWRRARRVVAGQAVPADPFPEARAAVS